MVFNWGYFLINDRDYWLPYLVSCAEAFRQKMQELPPEFEDWVSQGPRAKPLPEDCIFNNNYNHYDNNNNNNDVENSDDEEI